MAELATLSSMTGMGGKMLNFLDSILTPDQMTEFQQHWDELLTAGKQFQADVAQLSKDFDWAIQQAQLAILCSDKILPEDKLKINRNLERYSHGPRLTYAFFSNFNFNIIVSIFILILAVLM